MLSKQTQKHIEMNVKQRQQVPDSSLVELFCMSPMPIWSTEKKVIKGRNKLILNSTQEDYGCNNTINNYKNTTTNKNTTQTNNKTNNNYNQNQR